VEAREVIQAALDLGIGYFDSARAYADSERYYGTVWPRRPEERSRIFQASKSASRDRNTALWELDQTLTRIGIETLDLWQIHDVRTEADLEAVAGPGGALEAFMEARESGKVLRIGVTGHHDPDVLSRAVSEWPVDAVMMPVNPAEAVLGGFLDDTLPRARDKGLAVIGMKVLGGSHYVRPESGISAGRLVRFALAQGITVAIVGCSTPGEVEELVRAGQTPDPMSPEEQQALRDAFRPHAGQLAFYRKP
jgi:aryl-alcohol dehydrogenase-like predicted oxidoreductase